MHDFRVKIWFSSLFFLFSFILFLLRSTKFSPLKITSIFGERIYTKILHQKKKKKESDIERKTVKDIERINEKINTRYFFFLFLMFEFSIFAVAIFLHFFFCFVSPSFCIRNESLCIEEMTVGKREQKAGSWFRKEPLRSIDVFFSSPRLHTHAQKSVSAISCSSFFFFEILTLTQWKKYDEKSKERKKYEEGIRKRFNSRENRK